MNTIKRRKIIYCNHIKRYVWAAKTLAVMGVILVLLFAGIVWSAYMYGIVPSAEATVVSQLAEQNFGRHSMYYLIQAVTALILILAANTGYAAFPLLAVNLSKDHYLPRMFQNRGDRLGYSNGILFLSVSAIVLIIVFNGATEALIPLYALGVFIPFTLAQLGMMVKWWREKPQHWLQKFAINTIGASISFVVAMMFVLTKFMQVWPIFIFLPVIVYVFLKIRGHYELVAEQLHQSPKIELMKGNVIVVPVAGMTNVVANSIRYAQTLSPVKIIAVYVAFDHDEGKQFETQWEKWLPQTRLVVLHSPYRSITMPLMKWLRKVEWLAHKQGYKVTVVIPQFIVKRAWHQLLHNQSGLLIRTMLLYKRNITVITVPYHLQK